MSETILATQNLRKTYRMGKVDVPVLKGVNMRVQQLAPCVQHHRDPDGAAEPFAAEAQEGLRRGVEEQAVQLHRTRDAQRQQRVRQREDGVEVRGVEEIRLLAFEPRAREPALAAGAMPVAAAARDEIDRSADAAFVFGVAEVAGAALREGPQDAPFVREHAVAGQMGVEAGAQDRAEFAAHRAAAGGGTGGGGDNAAASRSSGLTTRPSRPAVTCR